MRDIGNKIVVVGASAAGKSTFSRKLAKKINIPLTLMDSIMWRPGWKYIGDEETAKQLKEISLGDKWIIEGYITTQVRTFLFERVDTIIYLDYQPLLLSWRYIKRWWKHRKNPRPELEGNPEKFSFRFLWLVFTKGEEVTLNEFIEEVEDKSKIIKLKSPQEASAFLKSI